MGTKRRFSPGALVGSEPSEGGARSPSEDVVLVHGRTEDGVLQGLRKRGDEVSACAMHPLAEGKPIHGDVVKLSPRPDAPNLFDVEVQHAGPPSRNRPAQVATKEYREGWDSIWARRAQKKHGPN